jgi:hypothetical protein
MVGHWTTFPAVDESQLLSEALVESRKRFTGLKELVFYHTDVSRVDFQAITEEGEDEENARAVALIRRSEKELLEEMVNVLGKARSEDEEWTSELPKIEVSRDWQWCWRLRIPQWKYCGSKSEWSLTE